MVDAAYIEIADPSIGHEAISVNKGELVYFQDVTMAIIYFNALIGDSDNNNLIVTVDNKVVHQLSATEALYNRRRIAYVSNDMALLSTESVQTNLDTYLKSIDAKASESVGVLLSKFNIDPNKTIINLTELEEYVVRIAIGLAKDPEVLILNNPYAQINPQAYKKLMDMIYELILDKDMTCLCCLSAKYLSENFPGRVID